MSTSIMEQQLVKLYFVMNDGKEPPDVSDDMQMAFSTAQEYNDQEMQSWISAGECLRLPANQLTKKYVFVFEEFAGAAFEFVRKQPAVVIGPRCLIGCFMDNETIPLGINPVFTSAMRNITVCSSGLKGTEKNKISQLVLYMGGHYLDVLNANCTHLVAATVKSIKYEKAAEIKLKILNPDWVIDVWEQSQKRNVHASDASFLERHKLPIFFSLSITSTGLTTAKKNEIKALIEANGGTYSGAFRSEGTDILILEQDSVGAPKFNGAVRSKKECLTPAWIMDSVKSGYALPIADYEVKRLKASTPTKDDVDGTVVRDFNPDCTELSEISHVNSSNRNVTINESIMSNGRKSNEKPFGSYREVLARLTLQQAKKAGAILDGCNIFLSGFSNDEKEKLNKILNVSGAIRYDELTAAITHVIVGDQVASELKKIQQHGLTPHLLTLEWLAKSIEMKALLPEDSAEYVFRASVKGLLPDRIPEPPSPSSKKNLETLHNTFKRPAIPKFKLDEVAPAPSTSSAKPQIANDEDLILAQYLQPPASRNALHEQGNGKKSMAEEGISQISSEAESQLTEFMLGKTFFVYGFTDEDAVQIVSDLENCGGTIVDENYADEVDYIILPTSCIGTVDFTVKGKQTVNCIWLESSIQDEQCYPMEYYFEPIVYGEDDPRPLDDEMLVISTYTGAERSYLISLCGILGAKHEDRLARKSVPIVICKEPSGAKYEAAIKWDLTVLSAEWLLECLKQKSRVPEGPYLVGESICSPKNVVELSRHGDCLPTTSTDDVDIDSVKEPTVEPVKPGVARQSAVQSKDAFKYITIDKAAPVETDVEYGFQQLSTPELRKLGHEGRQIYSQELQQYEDLMLSQRAQRKPFDPNHRAATATTASSTETTEARDSPVVLRHRRLSALAGGHSPATPGSSTGSSTSVTPAAGDYEKLSVTQRVMEFDTPVRDTLYKVLKAAEDADTKMSPRARHIKELLATPSASGMVGHIRTPTLPDCMTKPVTPYGLRPDASPESHLYHKRKLRFWDQFYKPSQTAGSSKDRRKSTPLSEIKQRFWRENLGDEYVDYIESKYSTQFQPGQQAADDDDDDDDDDEVAEASGSKEAPVASRDEAEDASKKRDEGNTSGEKRSRSSLEEESSNGSARDENDPAQPLAKKQHVSDIESVRRLSDFISTNRNSSKKTRKFKEDNKTDQYTEIQRFDSEAHTEGIPGGVGWHDPSEFDHAHRLWTARGRMSYKKTPVFALSSVTETLRVELAKKIQDLGGEVSTKPNEYDPLCTHIICGKPNRGEKILSAIAAGKWLLATNYLEDSSEAGHFLAEEFYEWGNPKAIDLPALESTEKQVSVAAFNWRNKISREAGKHDGVFTGFRVLLLAPKKEQFIRLLKSGGGYVIDAAPPFINSDTAMAATHCFVDTKKCKISTADHRALAQAGISVLSIMYLNDYLTSETITDPNKFRLEI